MKRTWPIVALLTACSPEGPATGVAREALVGGTVDDGGYPAVYYVRSEWNAMRATHCSATLIAPRVLLMAGHCVDPRKAGSTAVNLFAQNTSPSADDAGVWIPLSAPVFHPQYDPSDFRDPFDLGLALLPAPQGVAPIPINAASLDAGFVGQPLTAVGFGITSPSVIDPGTRRSAALTFRAVTATHLLLGDQQAKGICNGDSGGPSLHRFSDGVTRVVGVHSYTEPSAGCLDGADVRVDVLAAFIRQYLSDHVGAGCGEDGLCAQGCSVADPDCPPPLDAGTPGVDGGTSPEPTDPPGCGCHGTTAGFGFIAALALARRLRIRRP